MMDRLRLLVVGAHPDDAEYKAGGLAALYKSRGFDVLFVSVTDGSAGHHEISGPPLVARRRVEAQAAAATLGLEHIVWDHPDAHLEPNLARRDQVIRLIRTFRPDLVLTHRPNDYHPDHRATSQLVQDAAYLLTVPAVCPDTPHLPRDPVIAYLSDDFTKPCPFDPTVLLDIATVWEAKVSLLHAHTSQFYEWLPYNTGTLREVPLEEESRRVWLSKKIAALSVALAERFRDRLISTFGEDRGRVVHLVEAFEACEYGAPLDDKSRIRLFPFDEVGSGVTKRAAGG